MFADRITVIIPVYNRTGFLARCIDSVIAQSYSNLEIILVDDGSTDGSGRICDNYARQDSRIRVLHFPENRGPYAARNAALQAGTGTWITFADSDDYLDPDLYLTATKYADRYHADLVIWDYRVRKNDREIALIDDSAPYGYGLLETEAALTLLTTVKTGSYVWNKLFRKTLFDGISFPEEYSSFQDISTVCRAVAGARRIYRTPACLYNYCKEGTGITESVSSRKYAELVLACHSQYCFMKDHDYPQAAAASHDRLRQAALKYVIHVSDVSAEAYCVSRQALTADRHVPVYLTRNQRRMLFLFRHCRQLFEFLCIACGKRIS